eukprot:TRINITY_DN60603_c0_g1_i1.p1 TRINITY_DN60603_c0_g1~~TRINITY_DN60603_c0_g1_i1.p1  ORF type:complete len:745 (+),score=215.99 TRINITY_DN60603_c0_g1_i1:80-2236(+)
MAGACAMLLAAASSAPPGTLTVTPRRPPVSMWKRTQCGGPSGSADIPTKWAAEVDPAKTPLTAYPRPQMVRGASGDAAQLRDHGDPSNWHNLNGLWEWEPANSTTPPFGKTLSSALLVPFPVESCLSGNAPATSKAIVKEMWYRLSFDFTAPAQTQTLLNFGAVDWQTSVYLNGAFLGNHTGGYDGFNFDITQGLKPTDNELLVYVYDPSDEGVQPNGKQRISAIDSPGGDTYTPNSGIWQTVWLESVPQGTYIQSLKINQASASAVTVTAVSSGAASPVSFEVALAGKTVAKASGTLGQPTVIAVPGAQLWHPDSPTLYDLRVTAGADSVLAYFGLRTFVLGHRQTSAGQYQTGIDRPGNDMAPCGADGCVMPQGSTNADCAAKCNATEGCKAYVWAGADCSGKSGAICWLKSAGGLPVPHGCRNSQVMGGVISFPLLNGNFTFLAGFLDQSWWPDGQYVAPTDAALESDLTATKMFGLNMIRLHQKVNPERWYYHADRHGLVIFQDMPQKYGHAQPELIPYFVADLKAMIEGRGNHPCIVQWETFNEGDCWSVFKDKPYDVAGITQLAKQLDPTRLVDTDSGGGANKLYIADVNDIHTYPYPGDPQPSKTQYGMIGEFGGIGAFVKGKEWVPGKCHTYLHVDTPADEADAYIKMAKTIEGRVDHVSASVYTQTTDLELECDGFLNYDRTNKFDQNQTQAIFDANQAIIRASRKVLL